MKSILKVFKSNNKEDHYSTKFNIHHNLNHNVVQLSHLLLQEIVSHLTDNIDKVCFILTCRRWFQDRDRYLESKNEKSAINLNNYIKLYSNNNKKNKFLVNNYLYSIDSQLRVILKDDTILYFNLTPKTEDQIKKQEKEELKEDLKVDNNETVIIEKEYSNSPTISFVERHFDIYINPAIYKEIFTNSQPSLAIRLATFGEYEITWSYNNIVFLNPLNDCNNSNNNDTDSNSSTNSNNNNISNNINNYKQLVNKYKNDNRFSLDFNLDNNFFLNINDLYISVPTFIDCLEPQHFPPFLERLSLHQVHRQDFHTDLLPSTLKYLTIYGRNCRISDLPHRLEELALYGDFYPVSNHVLPLTLHTFIGDGIIEKLHENQSLTKLHINVLMRFSDTKINLPETLKDLTIVLVNFKVVVFPPSFIPASVETLSIQSNTPDNPQSQSTIQLSVQSMLQENSKLKKLSISSVPVLITKDTFPNNGCLETIHLDFFVNYDLTLDSRIIPPGVKELLLPYALKELKLNGLPNTVTTLYGIPENMTLDCIPQSVSEISFYFTRLEMVSNRFKNGATFRDTLQQNIQSIAIHITGDTKYQLKRFNQNHFIIFDNAGINFGIISTKKLDLFFKKIKS